MKSSAETQGLDAVLEFIVLTYNSIWNKQKNRVIPNAKLTPAKPALGKGDSDEDLHPDERKMTAITPIHLHSSQLSSGTLTR